MITEDEFKKAKKIIAEYEKQQRTFLITEWPSNEEIDEVAIRLSKIEAPLVQFLAKIYFEHGAKWMMEILKNKNQFNINKIL